MRISLFCFFLFSCPFLNAQIISNSVQNIGGITGISNNSAGSLTYSIGEMASIQSFTGANNYVLSTGFLQSFNPLVTGILDMPMISANSVTIAPNPTSQFLLIETRFNQSGTLQFQLLDAQSKIVFQITPVSIVSDYQKRIDLEALPTGMYYIKM